MFKCSIRVLPLPVSALFQYSSAFHTHKTRRSKFIHTPIGRNEATSRTLSYRGAHISYACFKNQVLVHPIPYFRPKI